VENWTSTTGIIIHLIRLERIYQLGTFITAIDRGKKCRNWPTSPKPKPADNRQIATDKQAKGKIRGKEMAKWMRARLGR